MLARAVTVISLTLMLASLQGCAHRNRNKNQEKVWVNPDKSNQQFYGDKAECSALSGSAGSSQVSPVYMPLGGGFTQSYILGSNMAAASDAASEKTQIFSDCMRGRGWVLTDKSSTQDASAPQDPGAMSAFMKLIQNGGYDWSQKGSSGTIFYVKNSSMKKKDGVITLEQAAYFGKPSQVPCGGSKVYSSYAFMTVSVKPESNQLKTISRKDFLGEKIVCETSAPGADFTGTYKGNSVISKWLKDNHLD
jgi:hypothetical protein